MINSSQVDKQIGWGVSVNRPILIKKFSTLPSVFTKTHNSVVQGAKIKQNTHNSRSERIKYSKHIRLKVSLTNWG